MRRHLLRALSLSPIVLVLLAASPDASAQGIPGFQVDNIVLIGSGWSVDSTRFPKTGTAERQISILDCEAYTDREVDIEVSFSPPVGSDYNYAVALEPSSGNCDETDIDPPTDNGCIRLEEDQTVSSSDKVRVLMNELMFGAATPDCEVNTDTDTQLFFIAQDPADPSVIYTTELRFRIDLEAPDAPELLSASPGDGQITLRWDDEANADDEDTLEYVVYWSTSELNEFTKDAAISKQIGSATSYTITSSVDNGVNYYVGVAAVDEAGNVGALSNVELVAPAETTDFWEHYQQSGGSDPGGFCFIATASYGTPMASELDALRAFRDNVLMGSAAGRSFVDTYYRWGRFAAAFIADKPALKLATRVALVPLVWIAKLWVALSGWSVLFILLTLGFALAGLRRAWLARIGRDLPPAFDPRGLAAAQEGAQ